MRGSGKTYKAVQELDDGDVFIVSNNEFRRMVLSMTDKKIKVVTYRELNTLYGHHFKKFSIDHEVLECGLIDAKKLLWLQTSVNRWGGQ